MNEVRKLTRPLAGRQIAGVCIGVANYLGLDPTVIRLVWALCVILGGCGFFAYLIAWVVIPQES